MGLQNGFNDHGRDKYKNVEIHELVGGQFLFLAQKTL